MSRGLSGTTYDHEYMFVCEKVQAYCMLLNIPVCASIQGKLYCDNRFIDSAVIYFTNLVLFSYLNEL